MHLSPPEVRCESLPGALPEPPRLRPVLRGPLRDPCTELGDLVVNKGMQQLRGGRRTLWGQAKGHMTGQQGADACKDGLTAGFPVGASSQAQRIDHMRLAR